MNFVQSEICGSGCLSCGPTQCEICDSENYYVLSSNGSCVKRIIDNCEIPSTDLEDQVCYQCLAGFVLNQNGKNCQEVPNRLKINDCERYHWDFSCISCKTKFYLNEERKCQESPLEIENCIIYKDPKVCSKCSDGYFFNINSGLCETITEISKCKVYSSVECQKCSNGYFQPEDFSSGNNLTKEFLQALLSYNINESNSLLYETYPVNNCAPGIVPNCKKHLTHNICKECENEYFLNFEGKCLEFPNRTIAFCIIYENENTCDKCLEGYYLQNNKCYNLQDIEGCINYSTTDKECLKCNLPTHYLGTGICYPRNESLNIKFCQDLNPILDECATCFSSFTLTDDKLKCLPHIPHCQTYISDIDPDNNEYTNINTLEHICELCETGYYLLDSKRKCEPQNKLGCLSYTNNTNECIECAIGYYLSSESCSRNTSTNCKEYSITDNECESCLEGYYLNGTNCSRYTARNCKTYNTSSDQCETCSFGFKLSTDSSICIPSTYINCDTVNDNNECDTCPNGYYLKENNCIPLKLQNCVINVTGTSDCSVCEYGFYITNDKSCLPYTAMNCRTYNTSSDECETCFIDTSSSNDIYYLKDGNCIKYTVNNCNSYATDKDECETCLNGYYLDSNKNCILNRLKNCQTTNIDTNTGFCTSCDNGYILKNNLCVELFVPGCVSFNNDVCNKCRKDLYLDSGKCKIRTKISCKTFVDNADECETCYEGYKLDSTNCYPDRIPFCKIYETRANTSIAYTCETCSEGYYPNTDKLSCLQQNVSHCSKYTSNTNTCTACINGYTFSNGNCTNDSRNGCISWEDNKCNLCRNGMYLDQDNDDEDTDLYDGDGICKPFDLIPDCIQYYENTNKCKYCIYGKKPNSDNTSCIDVTIPSNCLRMYFNTDVCEKCESNYWKSDINICSSMSLNNCLIYNDDDTNSCSLCAANYQLLDESKKCKGIRINDIKNIDNCLTYNLDYTQCLYCNNGYYLENNQCYLQNLEGCVIYKYNENKCEQCKYNYLLSNGLCGKRQIDPNCFRFDNNSNICNLCYGDYILNTNDNLCYEKKEFLQTNVEFDIDTNCKYNSNAQDLVNGSTDLLNESVLKCTVCDQDNLPSFAPPKYVVASTLTNCETFTNKDSCSQCEPGYDTDYTAPNLTCVTAATTDNDNRCAQLKSGLTSAVTIDSATNCSSCENPSYVILKIDETCNYINTFTDYLKLQDCTDISVSNDETTITGCSKCNDSAPQRDNSSPFYECANKNTSLDTNYVLTTATNCLVNTITETDAGNDPNNYTCQLCKPTFSGADCATTINIESMGKFGTDFYLISSTNTTAVSTHETEIYFDTTNTHPLKCEAAHTVVFNRGTKVTVDVQSNYSGTAGSIYVSFFKEFDEYTCEDIAVEFTASPQATFLATTGVTDQINADANKATCVGWYDVYVFKNTVTGSTDSDRAKACLMCTTTTVPTEFRAFTGTNLGADGLTTSLPFPYDSGIQTCSTTLPTGVDKIGNLTSVSKTLYGLGYSTSDAVVHIGNLIHIDTCAPGELLVFGFIADDYLHFVNFNLEYLDSTNSDTPTTINNMIPMICIEGDSELYKTPGAASSAVSNNVTNCQIHFHDLSQTGAQGTNNTALTAVNQTRLIALGQNTETLKCLSCKPGYKATVSSGIVTACTTITNCSGTDWMNACSACADSYSWSYDSTSGIIDYSSCVASTDLTKCDVYDVSNTVCVMCKAGYALNQNNECKDITTDSYCTTAGIPNNSFSTTTDHKINAYEFMNYKLANIISNDLASSDNIKISPYCSTCGTGNLMNTSSTFTKTCSTSVVNSTNVSAMDNCTTISNTDTTKCKACFTTTTLKLTNSTDTHGECVTKFDNCTKGFDNSSTDSCLICDTGYFPFPYSSSSPGTQLCKDESTTNCLKRDTSNNYCIVCKVGFMPSTNSNEEYKCVAAGTTDTDCTQGALDGTCLKCHNAAYYPFNTKRTTQVEHKIYSFTCVHQTGSNITTNADLFTHFVGLRVILQESTLEYNYDHIPFGSFEEDDFTAATLITEFATTKQPFPCVVYDSNWVITDCEQYDSNLFCTKCVAGKYIDTSNKSRGECTDFHVDYCAIVDNYGFCLFCHTQYILSNDGKTCTYEEPITSCASLKRNTNTGTLECVKCIDGYILTNSTTCTLNTAQNCYSKSNTLHECTKCYEGYILFEGQCTINRVSNCLKPHESIYGYCNKCKYGYALNNGKCNPITNIYDICALYDSDGNCSNCFPGYELSDNTCIINDLVQIDGCVQYVPGQIYCVQCLANLRLINGTCHPAEQISNCKHFNSKLNICDNCEDNYYLQVGTCMYRSITGCLLYNPTKDECLSCPISHILINGRCQIRSASNCEHINPIVDECLTCNEGYYFNRNSRTCVTHKAANCKTRAPFTNQCQSCLDKHYLTLDGSCMPHILENCLEASQYSNECIKCRDNYYLEKTLPSNADGSGYHYTDCKLYSAKNCKNYHPNKDECISCPDEYILFKNEFDQTNCIPILKENCQKWDEIYNKCTECVTSHFLYEGHCFRRTLTNCKVSNTTSDECLSCHDKFYLQQKKCYPYTVNNCQLFDPNYDMCSSCPMGFYLNNGKCIRISHSNCNAVSPSGNDCLSCESNFYLQKGNCLPYKIVCESYDPYKNACLSCPSNSYLESENKLCVPYSVQNCDKYHPFLNECISCVQLHFMSQGQCLPYTVTNCKGYHPNFDECIACHQGFYHRGIQCLPYNVSNCSSYSSTSDNCLNCIDDHYLSNGNCIPYTVENCKEYDNYNDSCNICDNKYYKQLVQNSLYICLPHDDVNNCIEYNKDYNNCSLCEENYFVNLNLNECIQNPNTIPGCSEYADQQYCAVCSAPYYLISGTCKKSSTFIPNCDIYKEDSICKTCENMFLLSDDSLSCNDIKEYSCETYLDVSNCKTCSGNKVISFYNPNDNTYVSGLNGTNLTDRRAVCVDSGIDNCVEAIEGFPDNKCLLCQSNYFLNDNHTCQQVTISVDNCEIYFSNGICAQCKPNYLLSLDKTNCSEHVSYLGPNCQEGKFYAEPQCYLCDIGYYLNENGDCSQCQMEGCSICLPETPHLCKMCANGYYMNSNMTCVNENNMSRADSGLENDSNCDDKQSNKFETTSIISTFIIIFGLLNRLN